MPFKPGQSGNPSGKKRTDDEAWGRAIRRAVNSKTPEGKAKLKALADVLVDEAMGGNMVALKEIGDRLDGKPAQAISADVTGGLTINVVKHGSVDPE